jgi:hypothetical protein
MVGQPGRQQAAFTAGELDPRLHNRIELKYFGTGCARAENVEFAPQGGFKLRDGLRHVGVLEDTAGRLASFRASDGEAYDLVYSNLKMQAWQSAELDEITTPFGTSTLPTITFAQRLDTQLIFHKDVEPRRIKHSGASSWDIDVAPIENLPNYDYGATYTNGVSAIWNLEFIGLSDDTTVFTLTVSNEETASVTYDTSSNFETLAGLIETAITDLPSVASGVTVDVISNRKFRVTFDGEGNEGDGWAISARVINKSDAAITAIKDTPGVTPGEAIISSTRGWPRCGLFHQQRLLMGGFRSLPNNWIASIVGDYFNFDDRIDEANGSFLVPMDTPGGEALERMVAMRNLLLFTNDAEYWLADRELSKTKAPNHVESSRHGAAPGVPIVENEGSAIFTNANASALNEFRYTDLEGNFVAEPLSLLASHMIQDVTDMAVRRSGDDGDGNLLAVVQNDRSARMATLLRSQEVTAFGRISSDGDFYATSANGDNQMSFIVERTADSVASRRLERMETGLLLDGAVSFSYESDTATITGLDVHEGQEVWAYGDDYVFGPFTVDSNQITLPRAVSEVTVGRWTAPVVTTLPPSREVSPEIVVQRRGRIHGVVLDLLDTTSVAIASNGGAPREINLIKFGATANVPDLQQGFTGLVRLQGLTGYADQPNVTITQLRPGRLNLRGLTIEAAL